MTCREVLRDKKIVALHLTKNSFPHSFLLFLLGVKVRIAFLYQVRNASFLFSVDVTDVFWSEYMVGASFYLLIYCRFRI